MELEELVKKIDTNMENINNNSRKIEKNFARITQNSGALEILKEFKDDSRKIFIILIIVLCMWFATIGGFLYYISTIDYEEIIETAEVDNENGNANACVGDNCNNGEINYGESESEESN